MKTQHFFIFLLLLSTILFSCNNEANINNSENIIPLTEKTKLQKDGEPATPDWELELSTLKEEIFSLANSHYESWGYNTYEVFNLNFFEQMERIAEIEDEATRIEEVEIFTSEYEYGFEIPATSEASEIIETYCEIMDWAMENIEEVDPVLVSRYFADKLDVLPLNTELTEGIKNNINFIADLMIYFEVFEPEIDWEIEPEGKQHPLYSCRPSRECWDCCMYHRIKSYGGDWSGGGWIRNLWNLLPANLVKNVIVEFAGCIGDCI